jgi:hypothetical protein
LIPILGLGSSLDFDGEQVVRPDAIPEAGSFVPMNGFSFEMQGSRIRRMIAASGAAIALCGAATSAYASAGCTSINGTFTGGSATGNQAGTGFSRGDAITYTQTASSETAHLQDTTTNTTLVATGTSWTYTVPADTTDSFQVHGDSFTGAGNWSCVAGSSSSSGGGGSTSSPQSVSQTVNNAQAAVSNGQQTLQNLNNWVANGVMGSFGLIGSSNQSGNSSSRANPKQTRIETVTVVRRLEQLRQQELALREELEERPQDADAAHQLAQLRADLRYARLNVDLSLHRVTEPGRQVWSITSARDGSGGAPSEQAPVAVAAQSASLDGAQKPGAPSSVSVGSRDLIEMCEGDELAQYNPARDMLGRRWNVWGEGRIVGAWDSLAQTKSWGLIGSGGVDYKVMPWLALGVSVGAETFETNFGSQGVRLGSFGFTMMPYAGFRLDENVFASVFVGLTPISYKSNPQPSTLASFNALRLMAGGALFGNWQLGDWRVRPMLSGTYGSEAQYGYTDSLGNAVAGQIVTYGRLSAGPEVGYTFWGPDKDWSVEPYVLAKANLDFASSNSSVLQGQSVVLRPGTLGSGTAGLGVDARFSNGVYLRVQGSYDSIGVTGLDVVSGMIRGGMTF